MNKFNKQLFNIILVFLLPIINAQSLDKIIVLDVKVNGNIRISDEDILRNARLWPEKQIDIDDIQKSIKLLWKLGRFSDIQIFVEEENSQGVKLVIDVKELKFLDKVVFNGNKKVRENTLKEKIDLNTGQLLSEEAIFNSINKIKQEYKEKNYHSIEIDVLREEGKLEFSEDLTFVIDEGKKKKIKNIFFEGNTVFTNKKLEKIFKDTKIKKWFLPWRGKYSYEKLMSDEKLLKLFYNKSGYYDFEIKNTELKINDNGIDIYFDLYEGPKYFVRNVNWEGNEVFSDEELSIGLNFKKGDIFDKEKFNLSLSEDVNSIYKNVGYFYSQITPEIIPYSTDSLDINFNIVENDIVSIRKILIGGNSKTHENVIRRRLHFYPGEIFNQNKLIDALRDIMMLNFFQNVYPNVQPVDEKNIDVVIDLEEKQTGQAQLSMGYNGYYGFTGGGAFEFPNFRGKGQNLSISYQRGMNASSSFNQPSYLNSNQTTNQTNNSNYQNMSFSFIDPGVFDTRNLFGVSISYSERGRGQSYLPFDIYSISGSTRWGRQFKWPDRFFQGTWVFSTSTSRYFADAISDLTSYFGDNISNSIVSANNSNYFETSGQSFTQIITRDSRNHPEYPLIGSKFAWKSTLAGSILGGDEDYHKHEFEFNWFNPIIGKLVLYQKVKTGLIKKIYVSNNDRSIIPPSTKFFLGGSGIPYGEMLRGYQDNTVGPFSYGSVRPRGGNIIVKYSMELRYQFSDAPTVYALMFGELGNVWTNFDVIDPFDLKRSAGIGIRTYMPMIGLLGFDMGYGFDDTIYDENKLPQGWNYHILFGMPF